MSPSSSARTSGRRAARSPAPARPARGCSSSSTGRRTSGTRTTPGSTWSVGGQDELVFDGDSIVVSAEGEVLARAPQFEEVLLVVDLDLPAATGGGSPVTAAEPVRRVT